MTGVQVHDLDNGIQEYFEFIVNKFRYRFRYPNTEEMAEIKDIKTDENAVNKFMFTFITSVDKDAPNIEEAVKKFTLPTWTRFIKMIESEFSGK